MASVAFQMTEEVTAHAQSDSLEDAREICADGTYFPNNLRSYIMDCNIGYRALVCALFLRSGKNCNIVYFGNGSKFTENKIPVCTSTPEGKIKSQSVPVHLTAK